MTPSSVLAIAITHMFSSAGALIHQKREVNIVKVRSPFTCEIETKAKNLLSAYQAEDTVANGNRAPMFIRGVFHDAIDANNLLEKDDSGNWVPNEADKSGLFAWSYGGVVDIDGCSCHCGRL